MKVEQFYNKNQFRLYGEGKNILQSYDSTVVVIEEKDPGTLRVTLGRDWDYSTTTRKHVYLFLEEYVPYNIVDFEKCKGNKRAYIQSLIDSNMIGYDKNLV